jgi:hypothetical protein
MINADNAKGIMGIRTEGGNGAQIKEKTQGSLTSVNSTSKIARRHSKPRDSENGRSGNREYADISLQDMWRLMSEYI